MSITARLFRDYFLLKRCVEEMEKEEFMQTDDFRNIYAEHLRKCQKENFDPVDETIKNAPPEIAGILTKRTEGKKWSDTANIAINEDMVLGEDGIRKKITRYFKKIGFTDNKSQSGNKNEIKDLAQKIEENLHNKKLKQELLKELLTIDDSIIRTILILHYIKKISYEKISTKIFNMSKSFSRKRMNDYFLRK